MKTKINVTETLNMITAEQDYADIARKYVVTGIGARSIITELNERQWRSPAAIADYLEKEFGYKFTCLPGRGWVVVVRGVKRKKIKNPIRTK